MDSQHLAEDFEILAIGEQLRWVFQLDSDVYGDKVGKNLFVLFQVSNAFGPKLSERKTTSCQYTEKL